MNSSQRRRRTVVMLGTFGLRPKATLRARALAIAQTLAADCDFLLITTPWDCPSDAGKRWTEHGIPVVNTRAARPGLFPLAVRQMIEESTASHPDVIHLFKPKGFGDLAARRLRRRWPVVVDMDDWEGRGGWNDIGAYGPAQRQLFDWQERTWPRKAAAVTVASRELERRGRSLGAQPDSIFYVPNGLTRDRFDRLAGDDAVEQRYGMSERATVLLYTRFVEFDPTLPVQVMSLVRREVPEAKLVVIGASGDGQAEEQMRREAGVAGMSDAIESSGWVDPEAIPAMLRRGTIAIHPFDDNLVNRSKCSVKLLELMASGVAVVSNDVGENAHVIEPGLSGMLAPAGDIQAMARDVVSLLRDPKRTNQMGEAARERIRQAFLWEQLAPRIRDVYDYAMRHGS